MSFTWIPIPCIFPSQNEQGAEDVVPRPFLAPRPFEQGAAPFEPSSVAYWLHSFARDSPGQLKVDKRQVQGAMNETNPSKDSGPDETIAAIDRELELAQELNRRHTEYVRNSRADDRPIRIERRVRPR